MAEAQGYTPRTYEELLMGRLGKLYDAKEEGNGNLFDEIVDEIEGLFGLAPAILRPFLLLKEQHSREAEQLLNLMKQEISALSADDITREILRTQRRATIEWEFRGDIMDAIIQLLNEYQMIPYQTGIASAEMEYGEIADNEGDEEYEEAEEEPVPAPKRRVEEYSHPRRGKPVMPPSVPEPPETIEEDFVPTPPATPTPAPAPSPAPAPPETKPKRRPAELAPRKRIKFMSKPKE